MVAKAAMVVRNPVEVPPALAVQVCWVVFLSAVPVAPAITEPDIIVRVVQRVSSPITTLF